MHNPPTVHVICGSTGAGKSTYSLHLAKETGAIRLVLDDWMQSLLGPDWPKNLTYQWALERVKRCENHSLELCKQLIPKGIDIRR